MFKTVIAILLLLSITCIGVAVATEVAVCTDAADQINPDVYGTHVVWEDHRSSTSRIYFYDSNTGTTAAIPPTLLSTQSQPAIYDDSIVYISNSKVGYAVCLYSIESGTSAVIHESTNLLETPDVYTMLNGVNVVWTEYVQNDPYGAPNSDIWLYSKAGLGMPQVTKVSTGGYESNPRISEGNIVWMHKAQVPGLDSYHGPFDIYGRSGSTGTPTLISTKSAGDRNIWPAVEGDRVVWQDSDSTDAYYSKVLLSNLPASSSDPVTLRPAATETPVAHSYRHPAVWGTRVAYIASDPTNTVSSLKVLDEATGLDFYVSASEHVSSPQICRDTVVWQDNRAGNWDIYTARATPTPITGCIVIDQPGYYTLSNDIINSACPVAIDIRCSNVLLDCQGHLVDGRDTAGSNGIRIQANPMAPLTNVEVRNARLTDWATGLSGMMCSNSVFSGVSAESGVTGISLMMECHDTMLSSGSVSGNSGDGILISDDCSLTITGSTIRANGGNGLNGDTSAVYCSNSLIADNGFGSSYGHDGFHFSRAGGDFYNNVIRHNQGAGIYFNHNMGGTIAGNTIINNAVGLSDFNLDGEGGGRTIYNNYFDNTLNTDATAHNTWNVAATAGPNIVGGPRIGGNYWAQPDGLGFSQTHDDTNHDGFCDQTYTVTPASIDQGASIDNLPLSLVLQMKPLPGPGDLPLDMNGDGKYEDVNGNGRADFNDVVLYFNQMAWIAANEPMTAFDYNGNGRIDFADVVWLFTHL